MHIYKHVYAYKINNTQCNLIFISFLLIIRFVLKIYCLICH